MLFVGRQLSDLIFTAVGVFHIDADIPVVGEGGAKSGEGGPGIVEPDYVAVTFHLRTFIATGRISACSVAAVTGHHDGAGRNGPGSGEDNFVPGIDGGIGNSLLVSKVSSGTSPEADGVGAKSGRLGWEEFDLGDVHSHPGADTMLADGIPFGSHVKIGCGIGADGITGIFAIIAQPARFSTTTATRSGPVEGDIGAGDCSRKVFGSGDEDVVEDLDIVDHDSDTARSIGIALEIPAQLNGLASVVADITIHAVAGSHGTPHIRSIGIHIVGSGGIAIRIAHGIPGLSVIVRDFPAKIVNFGEGVGIGETAHDHEVRSDVSTGGKRDGRSHQVVEHIYIVAAGGVLAFHDMSG